MQMRTQKTPYFVVIRGNDYFNTFFRLGWAATSGHKSKHEISEFYPEEDHRTKVAYYML